MQEIGGSAFFFFQKALLVLSNSIRLTNSPIWIILKKGPCFPYGGMFQDERYHYTASAVTDLRCFVIPVNLYELSAQE